MPFPHEGESPDDPQSETVSAPHRDDDPPTRSGTPLMAVGGLLALWIVLGIALVVVAILVAL
jgi:hypothetical protein